VSPLVQFSLSPDTHFDGSPSTRVRQEQRQQKLIHRLEMLQARYEGNRLLY
jgi:hypothetical protein